MLNEHDQDVMLRCRRLGHEVTFGYCRRETGGKPCRLILDCWWQRFDIRGFLQTHLAPEVMAQVEHSRIDQPPPKMSSLLDMIQEAKDRLARENQGASELPPDPPSTGSSSA